MRAAYLAILLAACAAPGPRQYAQGIPVAPSAPAFSPTLDAPITTGQPGYVGPVESLPRSPYTRVLPQTPKTRSEPGIWASDSVKAPPTELVVLGDPLVFDVPGDVDATPAETCATKVNAGLLDDVLQPRLDALSPVDRICFSLQAMNMCLDHKSNELTKALAKEPVSVATRVEAYSVVHLRLRLTEMFKARCAAFDRDGVRELLRAWVYVAMPDAITHGVH